MPRCSTLAATLHLPRHTVKHKIDYLGAAPLALAATAIVPLTTRGGSQYGRAGRAAGPGFLGWPPLPARDHMPA